MAQIPPGGSEEPPRQPLWRGQLAPREGTTESIVEPRQRRWLHPATLTVAGVLLLALAAAAITLVVRSRTAEPLQLKDLDPFDCVSSRDMRDESAQVDDLARVNCRSAHDGQVFATLTADADAIEMTGAGRRCGTALAAVGWTLEEVTDRGWEVRPVAANAPLTPGDRVICLVRDRSGAPLTASDVMKSAHIDVED